MKKNRKEVGDLVLLFRNILIDAFKSFLTYMISIKMKRTTAAPIKKFIKNLLIGRSIAKEV